MYDAIRPEHQAKMQALAQVLDEFLNPSGESKIGFALLCFDFGTGGYMNYIANTDRKEMLIAMEEFITRNQYAEQSHETKQ